HLRLHLEQVLAGLEDQEVGAALDEPQRLIAEPLDQLLEAEAAEVGIVRRGQEAGWAHRPGDESRAAIGGDPVGDAPGDLGARPGPRRPRSYGNRAATGNRGPSRTPARGRDWLPAGRPVVSVGSLSALCPGRLGEP